MIIDKLNNEIFYDYASLKTGINVRLFRHDLTLTKKTNNIELFVYIGGESGDARKFIFGDDVCLYANASNGTTKDISYDWLNYVIKNNDELSDKDIERLVTRYNLRIENDIAEFAKKKRARLIVLSDELSC